MIVVVLRLVYESIETGLRRSIVENVENIAERDDDNGSLKCKVRLNAKYVGWRECNRRG